MSRSNRHVPQLTRRQVMRLAAVGALGASASGWIEALAADTAAHPNRRKSCIGDDQMPAIVRSNPVPPAAQALFVLNARVGQQVSSLKSQVSSLKLQY